MNTSAFTRSFGRGVRGVRLPRGTHLVFLPVLAVFLVFMLIDGVRDVPATRGARTGTNTVSVPRFPDGTVKIPVEARDLLGAVAQYVVSGDRDGVLLGSGDTFPTYSAGGAVISVTVSNASDGHIQARIDMFDGQGIPKVVTVSLVRGQLGWVWHPNR